MHQALQGATFHLEHVRPRSRGGATDAANLSMACPGCNLHKSDRLTARDPETGVYAPLFNPRRQSWNDHFRWFAYHVEPLTPTGRATAAALRFNDDRRLEIRRAEEHFGLFPPPASTG